MTPTATHLLRAIARAGGDVSLGWIAELESLGEASAQALAALQRRNLLREYRVPSPRGGYRRRYQISAEGARQAVAAGAPRGQQILAIAALKLLSLGAKPADMRATRVCRLRAAGLVEGDEITEAGRRLVEVIA